MTFRLSTILTVLRVVGQCDPDQYLVHKWQQAKGAGLFVAVDKLREKAQHQKDRRVMYFSFVLPVFVALVVGLLSLVHFGGVDPSKAQGILVAAAIFAIILPFVYGFGVVVGPEEAMAIDFYNYVERVAEKFGDTPRQICLWDVDQEDCRKLGLHLCEIAEVKDEERPRMGCCFERIHPE